MAKFAKIWSARDAVLKQIVEAADEADAHREEEYGAAVKIQSWFRGVRLRAYLKYLDESAVTIQKNFRAFLGRKAYRQRLRECVQQMRDKYYNSMATRIQSAWRGYYVRKYVFNYYAYKLYMKGLAHTNEIVRARLKQEHEQLEEERLNREERLQEVLMQEEAKRHHYMLSTECKDGIFKSKNDRAHSFENQMRSIRFSQPLTKTKRRFTDKKTDYLLSPNDTPQKSKNSNTMMSPVSKDSNGTTLPPLVQKSKVQGPFRSLDEVRRQRVKPLSPTLRVATAYNSAGVARVELRAEEWRNRVIDEKFLPFIRREQKYQPLLHTNSSFEKPQYGTQTFRVESPSSKTQPFRTVVPPIPIFEKLNTTY